MNKSKKYYLTEDIRTFLFEEEEGMYEHRIDEISNIIIKNPEFRKRKCLITINDDTTKEMILGNYLTYLIIFEPFYIYGEEIPNDMIPDLNKSNNIWKYFDQIIKYFKLDREEDEEDKYLVGEILVEIVNKLNYITCEITKNYGPTIDLKTFIDIADRNEEFAKILYEPEINYSEETNFNAKDIIQHTHEVTDKIEEIIINDKENTFKKFITSGSGINMKQLGQVFGFIGLKPDLKEKIIPKPIDTNFCMGLKNISQFYINSMGCLKALITSKIQTKNSGYFTRKLEILLEDEFIEDVDDCGTKHLMPIEIKNENYINHLNNRYYSLKPNGSNLKKIDIYKNNDNLIGKTLYFRDPTMCACKNGICKKCYGDLWKTNINMNIGIIACLLLTNAFTQNALSTKHLLQANTTKKVYSPEFLKYFEMNMDKIVIKDEYINQISLAFDTDIEMNEESSSEEYQMYNFSVIDGDNIIDINEDMCFSLNTELNNILKSDLNKELDKYIISNKKLRDLEYIFIHTIDNNGLSRPMLMTKELIERSKYIKEHDIFELYDRFLELLDESGSYIDYIHIGVILKNLMSVEDGRESFKKPELPNIDLYCVPDAIQFNSKSISKPLLFERIKDQIMTDKYGTLDKHGTSNYDELMH